ncbi:phage tail assembly protein [Methylobacillus glycogenes]|uniref:phage tail assembly protein n=1 Tax=Methylobacillus glycogenes TaxID=406 RepID=UPI00055F78A1|nr:phage tail assembly protein [Methylobacillus glycogenes]
MDALLTIIDLDTPIKRKKAIDKITLRKPRAGELRGVSLTDLLQMDVNALQRVLPRITDPVLTDAEVQAMDPADLVQCGAAVSSFLLPKGMKAQVSLPE